MSTPSLTPGDTIGQENTVQVEITGLKALHVKVCTFRGKIVALGKPGIDVGLEAGLEVEVVQTREGLDIVLKNENAGRRLRMPQKIYDVPSTAVLFGMRDKGDLVSPADVVLESERTTGPFSESTLHLHLSSRP